MPSESRKDPTLPAGSVRESESAPAAGAPDLDSPDLDTPDAELPPVTVLGIVRLASEAFRAQRLTYFVLALVGVVPSMIVAHASTSWGRADLQVHLPLLFSAWLGGRVMAHLAIAYGVVSYLRAVPRSGMEMLQAAGSRVHTGIAAFVIVGLAVFAGMAILVVPGLLVLAIFLPIGAVTVMERRGVAASLRRAHDLTRSHQGALLGLLLAIGLGYVMTSCLPMLAAIPLVVTSDLGAPEPTLAAAGYIVMDVLLSTMQLLLGAIAPAAAYQALSGVPRPKAPVVF